MKSQELSKIIQDTGAILEGHFLLTSGLHSDRYIEKFRILENPSVLDKITNEMALGYFNSDIELVLGAAVGGILLAGGVGRHLGVKHIFTERVNGKMELKRGFCIEPDTRILIVDDILTTGNSVYELINVVKEYQGKIAGIVNLIDRSINNIIFDYPSTVLLKYPVNAWQHQDCLLCKKKLPLIRLGRTGKRKEIFG